MSIEFLFKKPPIFDSDSTMVLRLLLNSSQSITVAQVLRSKYNYIPKPASNSQASILSLFSQTFNHSAQALNLTGLKAAVLCSRCGSNESTLSLYGTIGMLCSVCILIFSSLILPCEKQK